MFSNLPHIACLCQKCYITYAINSACTKYHSLYYSLSGQIALNNNDYSTSHWPPWSSQDATTDRVIIYYDFTKDVFDETLTATFGKI